MYVRGPHKNLGSFERSLRIFPYYIPMKYETTQLSQTISVGGCGTVKERSRAVIFSVGSSFSTLTLEMCSGNSNQPIPLLDCI